MKKSLQKYLLTSLFCCLCAAGQAQDWVYKVNIGGNIGGTTPLPLPAEFRKLEHYAPVLAPHAAFEATHWLSNRWGITAQFSVDVKGFNVTDSVLYLRTEMKMTDRPYIGTFTGHNTTNIRNTYLNLPVLATYRLSYSWLLQGGMYMAWLSSSNFRGSANDGYIREGGPTGDKTLVHIARFDFSENQRTFDGGLLAAAEWNLSQRLALRGQLAWGLTSVFPSSFTGMPFKMYNVYGTLALSYLLKQS